MVDNQKPMFLDSLDLFCEVLLKPYPWNIKKTALTSVQDLIPSVLSLKESASDIVAKLTQGTNIVFLSLLF